MVRDMVWSGLTSIKNVPLPTEVLVSDTFWFRFYGQISTEQSRLSGLSEPIGYRLTMISLFIISVFRD
jgi:hypothetical protein